MDNMQQLEQIFKDRNTGKHVQECADILITKALANAKKEGLDYMDRIIVDVSNIPKQYKHPLIIKAIDMINHQSIHFAVTFHSDQRDGDWIEFIPKTTSKGKNYD